MTRMLIRKIPCFIRALLLCLMVICVSSAFLSPREEVFQDQGFLVIVNSDVQLDSISLEELGRIYLGKKRTLAGKNISRLASLESGDIHREFLETCLNRSHSSFINYWKRMVFTGKGLMPRVFSDENQLVEYVRKNKSAIGYISASTPHPGVNALKIAN